MAWIWSDELAEAAESAGLEHREIAAWRRRPVAFALPDDARPESLAREMLGLPPTLDDETSSKFDQPGCTCGAPAVLVARAAEG